MRGLIAKYEEHFGYRVARLFRLCLLIDIAALTVAVLT